MKKRENKGHDNHNKSRQDINVVSLSTNPQSPPRRPILPVLAIRKLGRDSRHARDPTIRIRHHSQRRKATIQAPLRAQHPLLTAAAAVANVAQRGPQVVLVVARLVVERHVKHAPRRGAGVRRRSRLRRRSLAELVGFSCAVRLGGGDAAPAAALHVAPRRDAAQLGHEEAVARGNGAEALLGL